MPRCPSVISLLAKKCVNSQTSVDRLVNKNVGEIGNYCNKDYLKYAGKSNNNVGPTKSPHIKHIRVCTGQELKKMCLKSKSCARRNYYYNNNKGGSKAANVSNFLLILIMKSLFAGGLVLLTYESGLWGDSENTENMWKDFCEMLGFGKNKKRKIELSDSCKLERSLAKKGSTLEIPNSCSKAMSAERALYNLEIMWNSAIVNTFWFFVKGPSALFKYLEEKSTEKKSNEDKKN